MQYDGSSSRLKDFLNQRWVKAVFLIDILAIIVIVGILIWNATKTAMVTFSVAPLDAVVTLSGQGDYQNGTYKLHPGNYEVIISHDGLESKIFDLELKSGYVTTLTAFLTGENSSLEFYELKANYTSFQKLAEIASADNNKTTDHDTSAEAFITKFQTLQSFYSANLPFEYSEYGNSEDGRTTLKYGITVRTSNEDACQKFLCIKAVGKNVDQAFIGQLLTERGFNLEDYEVHYQLY